MKRAGQMLPKAVGRDEVLRTARAQRVLRDWPEVVGEALASRSYPDRYGKGTVWVAVTGSAWAQELRMRKDVILQRLRERAGDPSLFLDVRFGVRPLPPPEVAPEEGPVNPTEETPRLAELSIREIAQRRLRQMRGEES
jgi:predicted nucleic acid-binding Zn ribbon protein